MNWDELIKNFSASLGAKGFSPVTVKLYAGQLESFGLFLRDRGLSVLKLNPKHADEYLRLMAGKYKAKPYSLCLKVRSLKRLYEWLHKSDLMLINPTAHLREPALGRRLPRAVLSEKETLKVLEEPDLTTLEGLRDRAMLEVLYGSGLRAKELLSLTVHDLAFDSGTAQVRKGKGAKARLVPLTVPALEFLKAYVQKVRPKLARQGSAGPALWLHSRGGALSVATLENLVRAYGKAAGLEKRVTPHGFRHSFATALVRSGVDLRHVQSLLGHSKISTTQTYSHVAGNDLKKAHKAAHPRFDEVEDLEPKIEQVGYGAEAA